MSQKQASAEDLATFRDSVRQLCDKFGEDYWLRMDRDQAYPTDFVDALTASGFLGVLIP